jgi:MOSC domain-containing protein YiiM
MSGRIVQISAAAAGGVPKPPVLDATVDFNGIVGNAVAHPKIHGGPDRALCLYSEEHILALQREGHPIRPGFVGENVTIGGLDWHALQAGMRLQLGAVLQVELTTPAAPCRQVAFAFADRDSSRIAHKRHPGWARWYARVIAPGHIRTGDAVRLATGGQFTRMGLP